MRIVQCVSSLVGLAALALGCSPAGPDPRNLFLEAAASAEAIPVATYRFEATVENREGTRRIVGTALLERLDLSGSSYRARIEALHTAPDGTTSEHIGIRQRDDVYLLEPASRTAKHASLYAGGSGLLYRLGPAVMYAFFDPRAVASEAEAATVEYRGRAEVLGEPCHMLYVTYDDDDDDSRWCLGVDDHLPRLMEWKSDGVTETLEIADIEGLEAIDENELVVDLSDDWTLSDGTAGPAFGSPVEPWSLRRPDGSTLASSDLLGEVVVLDFWATWCPPCITTLDKLEQIQHRYEGRPVRFLAVNTLEDGDPLAFVAERGYTFEVGLEGDELHERVSPGNLPAFAVIDAEGRWGGVGLGYYGEGSDRHMERLIETALSGTG